MYIFAVPYDTNGSVVTVYDGTDRYTLPNGDGRLPAHAVAEWLFTRHSCVPVAMSILEALGLNIVVIIARPKMPTESIRFDLIELPEEFGGVPFRKVICNFGRYMTTVTSTYGDKHEDDLREDLPCS